VTAGDTSVVAIAAGAAGAGVFAAVPYHCCGGDDDAPAPCGCSAQGIHQPAQRASLGKGLEAKRVKNNKKLIKKGEK
jgi:hypothetical protein